jgi:uncharacterized integral membrane protein (TIGR00697 family)
MKKFFAKHWLVIIYALFAVLIVVGPILGTKVVNIWGLTFGLGLFPTLFAFNLLDIVNEFKGKWESRRVVWVGTAIKAAIFLILIPFALWMPGVGPSAILFNKMMTFGLRLFIASELVNILQTIWIDIPIFNWLKQFKIWFFIRSNLSNMISWTIAGILFVLLGYWGTPLFSISLLLGQVIMRFPLTLIYTTLSSAFVAWTRDAEPEEA